MKTRKNKRRAYKPVSMKSGEDQILIDGQGTRGLGQIIVHPVIVRIDIDSPSGRRFVEIDILERAERLDLVVSGQLIPVPASAERADERDGGPAAIRP